MKIVSVIKVEPLCKYAFYVLGQEIHSECVVVWLMVPKDAHVLILETCEYGSLHDKRDFADVVALRSLREKDYPAGSNEITGSL